MGKKEATIHRVGPQDPEGTRSCLTPQPLGLLRKVRLKEGRGRLPSTCQARAAAEPQDKDTVGGGGSHGWPLRQAGLAQRFVTCTWSSSTPGTCSAHRRLLLGPASWRLRGDFRKSLFSHAQGNRGTRRLGYLIPTESSGLRSQLTVPLSSRDIETWCPI